MITELCPAEISRVVDRVADDLLWEACVDRPPVDAFTIARRLQLRVVSDRRMPTRGRFVHTADGTAGTVIVGAEQRPERRQWAVAHEIGEAFAYRAFDYLGVDPAEAPATAREEMANALAGRLLAPAKWLVGVYESSEHDLHATKRAFESASYELLARRLLETLDWPIIASVFDHNQLTWRRHSQGGRMAPLLRAERLAQRRSHQSGRPTALLGEHAVRCWPIHEPGWKREIVLCEAIGVADEAVDYEPGALAYRRRRVG